jgi:hypothetical protein
MQPVVDQLAAGLAVVILEERSSGPCMGTCLRNGIVICHWHPG